MNKQEELEWILATLRQKREVYLLADIIEYKDYCVDDIHEWARSGEYGVAYGKIRDLLQSRIYAAIESGKLEKTVGEGMLKVFYYRKYEAELDAAQQRIYTRMDKVVYNGETLEYEVGG